MTIDTANCPDCHCQVAHQTIERASRHLTIKETVFSCGARRKELADTESQTGKVEFEGCCCAC